MKSASFPASAYSEKEANLFKSGLVREGVFDSERTALIWARRHLSSWVLIPYAQVGRYALFSSPSSYLNPIYYDGTGTIFPGEKLT